MSTSGLDGQIFPSALEVLFALKHVFSHHFVQVLVSSGLISFPVSTLVVPVADSNEIDFVLAQVFGFILCGFSSAQEIFHRTCPLHLKMIWLF